MELWNRGILENWARKAKNITFEKNVGSTFFMIPIIPPFHRSDIPLRAKP
jgi:hypothetical protein